jgi:hypothetical protein
MVIHLIAKLININLQPFHNLKKFCRLFGFKFTRSVQKDLEEKILPDSFNYNMQFQRF